MEGQTQYRFSGLKLALLKLALIVFAVVGLATVVCGAGRFAHAAAPAAQFEFTCETSEDDFYDWLALAIWKKPDFGRNLDAAFDALTSNADWTIRVTDSPCADDAMNDGRREALYLMIEDAHSEGFGFILYGF